MKFVRSHWFIVFLSIVVLLIFIFELLLNAARKKRFQKPEVINTTSLVPGIKLLSNSEEDI